MRISRPEIWKHREGDNFEVYHKFNENLIKIKIHNNWLGSQSYAWAHMLTPSGWIIIASLEGEQVEDGFYETEEKLLSRLKTIGPYLDPPIGRSDTGGE